MPSGASSIHPLAFRPAHMRALTVWKIIMDPLWIEVAKQAPTLVVLVWLVVYFLKHLAGVNKEHAAQVSAIIRSSQEHEDRRDKERADDEDRREALTRTALERNSTLYERVLENIGKIKTT